MPCTGCRHEDHLPGPCAVCAATNNACGGIKITGGDGDSVATGQIEMASGLEQHPCLMCISFEKDRDRLVRHLLRHKLTPEPDGTFVTPIAKDFPGRKSLRIDPRSYGWCRRDTIIVDMLATCPAWRLATSKSELASRIS
jgi:hypothetical protein